MKTGYKNLWVSGITFDEVIRKKGGWLPNKLHRYCTTHLKLEPIFYWWAETIKEPCIMQIGFRANENRRAHQMLERTNENGLLEMKATFSKHANGNNRWEMVEWQKPEYPLIAAGIFKDNVENYWKDKPVRFARLNNCVGCFHRNPLLLKKQFEAHPGKMNWFKNQEGGKNGYWRSDTNYKRIENHKLQIEINFDDFSECDSGYCGI